MNALFVIRKDDDTGLEYLRNIADKIVGENLGDVEVTEAGDYYEYRIDVSNENLLLL